MSARLCEICGRPLLPLAHSRQRVHAGKCRRARSKKLMKQWYKNNKQKGTIVQEPSGPPGAYIQGPAAFDSITRRQ